jgi:8-oxo-dGTP diphosphatase
MSTSGTTRVLAALIVRDGRWLLGLRPYGKRHAGWWEFPGGKVEPGESDADAMARELREELDLTLVSLGAERVVQRDGDSPFEITFVEVEVTGTPRALEHAALAWVAAEEFARYPLAPSDLACARVLAEGFVVEPPPVRNPAQHEAYLQNSVRDAEQFNEGLVDVASYASYIEYACGLESVRVPLMQLVRAQAQVATDDVTREALHALVARIAAMPAVMVPEPPPPPPRPAWVMLSHLRPGERVLVRTAFRTFDGGEIAAGRTFTFVGYTLFPYDDGYTFSFEEGGFRLSGLVAENEAVLVNEGERYFVMAP